MVVMWFYFFVVVNTPDNVVVLLLTPDDEVLSAVSFVVFLKLQLVGLLLIAADLKFKQVQLALVKELKVTAATFDAYSAVV
ncbi:hypothetical protein VF13_39030 [Nostoc linckia z16]|nr:hypothetical protein VF13_39030 [Nostoc linckia z16]